jgi:hypothetical protein
MRASSSTIHNSIGFLNYLHAGWWICGHGLVPSKWLRSRDELHRYVASLVAEPADILEFGVFRGDSIRQWATLCSNPETRIFGFDSFEGLPEDWRLAADRSTFNVGGSLPDISDRRVVFCKGWFQETLPGFLRDYEPARTLLIHLDADLYSSTSYVLSEMQRFIVSGTVLLFDEFFDREHELRAFDEFLHSSGAQVECIAATDTLTQAAFRVIEAGCSFTAAVAQTATAQVNG